MPRRSPGSALAVGRARGVTTLTIHDGEAGLSPELHAALAAAAVEIDLDDDARVVVLRARGRAFCRGGARLALTQLRAGVLPCHGGTQRLPRIVGTGRALAMLLLAESLTARAASEAGLLQRVCPPRELWRAGARLAADMASRAPIAQRLAKEALRAASDLPLAEGLRLEGDLYVLLQSTSDRDEGIASFRERRRPVFRGR